MVSPLFIVFVSSAAFGCCCCSCGGGRRRHFIGAARILFGVGEAMPESGAIFDFKNPVMKSHLNIPEPTSSEVAGKIKTN